MCARISLSNGFSQQLCYVPEDEQPERALTRLMDVGLVTPNDVVLINTGANQMGGDEPMMLRGVQGLVDLLRRPRRACRPRQRSPCRHRAVTVLRAPRKSCAGGLMLTRFASCFGLS